MGGILVGWLKVNVNASVKEDMGGLGVVFRNDLENMVLSCAAPKNRLLYVLTVELHTLWLASIIVKDRDFLDVIFESNSVQAISLISGRY